jgi:uncharacterized protein YndB with AHSA1/START domain
LTSETTLMSDFGEMIARDTLRIERTLPGPIERVWSFLVDSDKRGRWLASGAIELRPGGRVHHDFHNSALGTPDERAPAKYASVEHEAHFVGRVLECEAPRLLAYVWGDDSQVRFELTPVGDAVRLVVIHSLVPNRDQALSVAGGWHAHLDILHDVLRGVAPTGFWARHARLEAEYEERFAR